MQLRCWLYAKGNKGLRKESDETLSAIQKRGDMKKGVSMDKNLFNLLQKRIDTLRRTLGMGVLSKCQERQIRRYIKGLELERDNAIANQSGVVL